MIFNVITTLFDNVCIENKRHSHLGHEKYFENIYFEPLTKKDCKNKPIVPAIEWAIELSAPSYLFSDEIEKMLYIHVISQLRIKNFKLYILFDSGQSTNSVSKYKNSKGIIKLLNFQNKPCLNNLTEVLLNKDGNVVALGFLNITNMPIDDILSYLKVLIDDLDCTHYHDIFVFPNDFDFIKKYTEYISNNIDKTEIEFVMANQGIRVSKYARWHVDDPFYSFIGAGARDLINVVSHKSEENFINL